MYPSSMVPSFFGRRNEASDLDRRFRGPDSQFVVIYGRRRVGKSSLIREFCDKKRALYHVGDRSQAALQRQKILHLAAETLNEPLLRETVPRSWHHLFEILTPLLFKKRSVLALDEFQWMCESSPELPSVLQEFWDRRWEKSGKTFLILCGSYVGFMEREVLGKKSPLFGRRTAQLWLQPLSYLEAREFHPHYSLEEAARVLAICGGVPAYLQVFKDDRSVEQNIIQECLAPTGRLLEEPRFLTMEELRDPVMYFSLLEILQSRRLGVTELAKRLVIDKSKLTYYLNTLMQLGYVQKVQSLELSRHKPSARGQYRIADALLRFWFSLVYPSLNDLSLKGPEGTFTAKIKPRLEAYYGIQFERLCRQALPRLLARQRVTASYRIGAYWDRAMQIDLLTEREDGITQMAECKWQNRPVGMDTVEELRRKMSLYPNSQKHTLVPQLFSRSGFTAQVQQEPRLERYTLDDLYR
jgi:AAA+ ATPase superfamily predicted ATPase